MNGLRKIGYPRIRPSASVQNVLFVSTSGIGDTLWGTPALRSFRESYPSCRITVLTSPVGAEVLKHNPRIDEIFTFRKSPFRPVSLFRILRKKQFDHCFVFHLSDKWVLAFCYFLGIPSLTGFTRHAKELAFLFTDSLPIAFEHPVIQRNELIRQCGADPRHVHMEFFLTEQEKEKARRYLRSEIPWIGIQPGASQLFKQWPPKHFIQLIRLFSREMNARFILFGNRDELPLAETISREHPCLIASGQFSLRDSAALIGQTSLFITNDTGPMHLALTQKVPLVALFSPTDHRLCWPYLDSSFVTVVAKPKTCFSCVGKKCHQPFCMERISPETVFDRAKSLLASLKTGGFSDISIDTSSLPKKESLP